MDLCQSLHGFGILLLMLVFLTKPRSLWIFIFIPLIFILKSNLQRYMFLLVPLETSKWALRQFFLFWGWKCLQFFKTANLQMVKCIDLNVSISVTAVLVTNIFQQAKPVQETLLCVYVSVCLEKSQRNLYLVQARCGHFSPVTPTVSGIFHR